MKICVCFHSTAEKRRGSMSLAKEGWLGWPGHIVEQSETCADIWNDGPYFSGKAKAKFLSQTIALVTPGLLKIYQQ